MASSSKSLTPATMNDYTARLQSSALKATRAAAALPLPSDLAFQRSMEPEFAKGLDRISSRVMRLANRMLALADTSGDDKGKKKRLEAPEDVLDNFHSIVVDSMDELLERTDMALDVVLGRVKPPAIVVNPPKQKPQGAAGRQLPGAPLEPHLQHAAHLAKPQLRFGKDPDNGDEPWVPVRRGGVEASTSSSGSHPYYDEITSLAQALPPSLDFTEQLTPVPPIPLTNPVTYVNTPELLVEMAQALRGAKEIALDLEHHGYRTYRGFLCLMQVSTRERDWVVDLLEPDVRRGVEDALGGVLSDPEIVKVLHGADSDIVWLQQDFNLYIVNMFDTYHASKLLELPRHGLKQLLEMYCDVIVDKRWQVADWRIRPLPEEMLEYARSDTHYLLFIYDQLRNALFDRGIQLSSNPSVSSDTSRPGSPSPAAPRANSPPPPPLPKDLAPGKKLLYFVHYLSSQTALRVYVKEVYDAEGGSGMNGWDTLARKWNKGGLMAGDGGVGGVKAEVYRAVHAWRDRVAREEDESIRYVMPNHHLFQFAENPPADMKSLLAIFRGNVPPVLRRRAGELWAVVKSAVGRGVAGRQVQLDEVMRDGEGQVDEVQVGEKVVRGSGDAEGSSGLWGGSAVLSSRSASSSLFGNTLNRNVQRLGTSQSALFGKMKGKSSAGKEGFQEIFKRITGSLVIVPSVPKAVNDATASVEADEVEKSGMIVEIPFVPAAERQNVKVDDSVEKDRDAIVVVGRTKKTKRKIKAKTKDQVVEEDEVEGGSSKKRKKEMDGSDEGSQEPEPADVAPFDFATTSNILDENPELEEGARKKKRQRKQAAKRGGTFYGDFPAPPKAHSELKSGNQSYTFKK